MQAAAASTVSALNLNSTILRNPQGGGHPQGSMASAGGYLKPSMDHMSQMKSSHVDQHSTLMNQNSWNSSAAAFSLHQAFQHAAGAAQQQQQQNQKAPGGVSSNDGRAVGPNSIGGGGQQQQQRKGNPQQGGVGVMTQQGLKYGYSGQVNLINWTT